MRRRLRQVGHWLLDGFAASASSMCGEPLLAVEPLLRTSDLPVECEAFLAGHYLELSGRCRGGLPWTCINAIAHGERRDLERLAERSDASDPLVAGGSYLAGEVIAACDRSGVPLRQAQRELLVPIELELISTPSDLDLAAVVTVVEVRLREALVTWSCQSR